MRSRRQLLAGALVGVMLGISPPAVAAPAIEGSATDPAQEASVERALESGDLSTARERATAARVAEPSPGNWLTEARVLDALGDAAAAADAYRGCLDALGAEDESDTRAQVEARLEALANESRGTVADEPASTHREELDQERADRRAQTQLKPAPAPAPESPAKDRIVKKWYFWVTLAAIAGAAGAITAISIKAADQERKDSLDRTPAPASGPGSAVLFRF